MKSPRRTIAIVTGTRAEFGLLRPVIDAINKHPRLTPKLIVAGSHFLPPARTAREVAAAYPIAARVPMQRASEPRTRTTDALATARGLAGFTRAFAKLKPDWVLVLGDRIEAFAAATAASISGIGVCHIHGGDRAEGIADEAMRHAITKLAHLHAAATAQSANRIIAMGEPAHAVHITGSPAIDGLAKIKPMSDADARTLGDPHLVVLLHPSGLCRSDEHAIAREIGDWAMVHDRALLLAPNADAGRDAIMAHWQTLSRAMPHIRLIEHLSRDRFIALLKRLAHPPRHHPRGLLIGNSSAGLIEAAAIGLPVVNVGPRQRGRERGTNVIDVAFDHHHEAFSRAMHEAIEAAASMKPAKQHPYGHGRAGEHIAKLLAQTDPVPLLRKRNSY